jgi:hypothetical protein
MSSLTDYGERLALNTTTNAVSGNTPANTRFVALYSVAPGEAGGGTELSGNGYTRKAITFPQASTDGETGATSAANSAEVLFDTATDNWTDVVAMAIFDASSGGNMIWYCELASTKVVASGDRLRFPASSVTLMMS